MLSVFLCIYVLFYDPSCVYMKPSWIDLGHNFVSKGCNHFWIFGTYINIIIKFNNFYKSC
jgi:hypothetical protein